MAIINKIRQKSGIAIGAIGGGMILFLLGGDLLSSNSSILGKNKQVVGEVAGEEISLQQFNNAVERFKGGRSFSEAQMAQVRTAAWNELVREIAYGKEAEQLGITVTEAEHKDMINGDNIDPTFARNFIDSTGQVNREQINNYLNALQSMDAGSPYVQQQLYMQEVLKINRQRQKYVNLIGNTYFANKLEAKQKYQEQNTTAEVVYVNVPYYSVPDSAVEISDSDLSAYFNSHKEDFKQKESRGIKFVSFPIEASEDDQKELKGEISKLIAPFKNAANDTAFIAANTEGATNFMTVNMTGVPSVLNVDELKEGEVYGPYFAANAYRIYKVEDIAKDTAYTARASHILYKAVKGDAASEAEAKKKAEETLRKVRSNPASFEDIAKTEGDAAPQTKSRGGDLQWFAEGRMVKPFNDAVFNASRTGIIPRLIKTDFGYHIIKVTATKTNKQFVLGVIEKALQPSQRSVDTAFGKAMKFASSSKNEAAFNATAEEEGLFQEQALNITPEATYINSMRSSGVRSIVRWAYEADMNDVSNVFELEDRYVVAALIAEKEEGTASLDEVKDQVRREVLKEKKIDYIAEKLSSLEGSVEDIKDAYGAGATIQKENDLTAAARSLQGAGSAPKTIGTIFGMQEGTISSPIKDENGVTIVKLVKINKPLETADYSIYRKQIEQTQNRTAESKVFNAVSELAEVEDNRHDYF
ncbi:SurA N-terminal domain-containing protein [Algivirga pacifica]|uniref:Periplasmic chaperone PpiD n=1 Tax=Algivirga pacifica TaxID=1162670 RepID=A0ABP9DPQ7_9BACT